MFALTILLALTTHDPCDDCKQCTSCPNIPFWVAHCTRVIDGDTIEVTYKNSLHKIRLLGVDTPETVNTHTGEQPGGKEASEYTHKSLEGRDVVIEFESNRADNFGRMVGMVRVDGVLFNKRLIELGYGYYYPRFKFDEVNMGEFKIAEEKAQKAKLGVWGKPKVFAARELRFTRFTYDELWSLYLSSDELKYEIRQELQRRLDGN